MIGRRLHLLPLLFIAWLAFGLLACQNQAKNVPPYQDQETIDLAEEVMTSALSDGISLAEYDDRLLRTDWVKGYCSTKLFDVKRASEYDGMWCEDYEILRADVTQIEDDTVEVFLATEETNVFPDFQESIPRENFYRILFYWDGGAWVVTHCLADDATSSIFFPELMADEQAFRAYDWQGYRETFEDRMGIDDDIMERVEREKPEALIMPRLYLGDVTVDRDAAGR